MKIVKKRTGRPPKIATPGSRVSLGLKVTARIKGKLDAQAKSTGRTQSQEAELRLEQSFWREELLPQALRLAYGETLAGVLLTLGETIKLVGMLAQHSLTQPNIQTEPFKFTSWEEHPKVVSTAFNAAKKMLDLIVDPNIAWEFAVPGEDLTGEVKQHAARMGVVGFSAVVMILKELQSATAGSGDEKWEEIRELLGPLAARLPSSEKGSTDAR